MHAEEREANDDCNSCLGKSDDNEDDSVVELVKKTMSILQ